MSQTAWPLDDTPYVAQDLRLWHIGRTAGIVNATGDDFAVTPVNGINVSVTPGFAYLNDAVGSYGGIVFGSTETEELSGQIADTNDRYDYVCVRYTKSSNAVELKYVVGTSNIPTPQRSETMWELIVAIIHVRASSESILQSDITDVRLNEAYCGLCVDTLTSIPTSGLQSQFDSWFSNVKGQLSTDAAGNLQTQITQLQSDMSDLYNKIINGETPIAVESED